jgi:hypothetical protein
MKKCLLKNEGLKGGGMTETIQLKILRSQPTTHKTEGLLKLK